MKRKRLTRQQLLEQYRRTPLRRLREVSEVPVNLMFQNLCEIARTRPEQMPLELKYNFPTFWEMAKKAGVTSTNELVLILTEKP